MPQSSTAPAITKRLNLATPEAMHALGAQLARALVRVARGDPHASAPADAPRAAVVVAFEGELGAGKTTLISGLLHALGVRGAVRSPTYTLIEPYEVAGLSLYHLDLYRLADPQDVETLGLRDLLSPAAVLLIEWPSRGAGWLPQADLECAIDYAPAPAPGRTVTLRAGSPLGHKVLQRMLAAMPE
jgi:tRNA threonylcarbamoyladenosine biosynthesis protein TsaE